MKDDSVPADIRIPSRFDNCTSRKSAVVRMIYDLQVKHDLPPTVAGLVFHRRLSMIEDALILLLAISAGLLPPEEAAK